MRRNPIERQKELECAIALRKKEAEDLRRRKTELQGELTMAPKELEEDNLSAAYPVLDYCGARPRKDVRSLPIEQVGNVLIQFDIALRAIKQRNRTLHQQVQELNRRIEAEGKRYCRVKQNTKLLADYTGAPVSARGQANGRKALTQENGSGVTLQELGYRKALIEKEIRTGRLLLEHKEDAILKIANELREREDVVDEIDALNNDIRVTDRDTKYEKETLRELISEHDVVVAKLGEIEEVNASTSRLLTQNGVAEIRDEIGETVNGTRRPQERIIKAQDYRIEQLERRLECIEKALQSSRFSRNVGVYITQRWSSNNELITIGDDADMYDLDAINPTDEKCHPAILELLLAEKERLSNRNALLDAIAQEKERVVGALACKVEALSRECQEAIQELDQVASGAVYEEEKQRLKAMEYIQEQRLYYSSLFLEKQKLKSKVLASSRKIRHK